MTTLTSDRALATAAHHHALHRPGSSIVELASELVGLHNTSPVTPYLSLRARMPGFERSDLDTEMYGAWRLARLRAMRLTMFVLPHDLLEVGAAATRAISESLADRWLRDSGLRQRDFDRLAAAVEEALAAGPLTARALRRALRVPQSVDLPGVIGRMCDLGRIVGGAAPRSWRSGVREYHRWSDVLPSVDLHRWDERAAIAELIARYVSSYGPVTVNDVAWWTGLGKGTCRAALEPNPEIEEVAVDDWPGPLHRIRASAPPNDLGSNVVALPLLDPYVQGYRDRTRFLAPERHGYVYDGGGNAAATLVYRGRIIGVWQTSADPESVRYHLFDRQATSLRRATEAELAAAGATFFDREVEVVQIHDMLPLRAGGGRSASHPLDATIHRASRRQQA